MSVTCLCFGGSKNTGLGTQTPFGVTRGLFYVPKFDSAGNRNSIPSSQEIDDAFILSKIQESDPTKRWYPLFDLKNVTDERVDPSFETFTDNSRAIVAPGLRTFTAEVTSVEPTLLAKLDAMKCDPFGVYKVDSCKAIMGEQNSDGSELYPLPVNRTSVENRNIEAVEGTNTQKIRISFDYSQGLNDRDMAAIPGEAVTADLFDREGLLDVDAAVSAITTSSFTAALSLQYGGFGNRLPAENFVLADFALYNVTQDASITITTVTESATIPGSYDFTFPVQTSADVLRLTSAVSGDAYTKAGFEIAETSITIP